MQLSFFNSMGRLVEPFKPLTEGKAGFYGCGPTVYNYAHIGNLRAYVTHDILSRTLRRAGYDTTYVMNITDVGHLSGDDDTGDDKMVKSAVERGKSVLEVAKYYTDAFFNDTDRLNIHRPDVVCKATDHIPEMIALIKRIEANGFTYFSGGNLYFDITKFPAYGKLANLDVEQLKAGARIDVDPNKKNPLDFVLWFTKSKFENQALVWDSPWGRGYPGWHIECSAMSMKYLGDSFDLHAGGIDHIPIHHTNEIAQSEAATGKKWVNYWVHNEFLVLDKGKMSKSKGDFLTLQTLIEAGYEALDYRYLLLGGHYRAQLQFSYTALDGAKNARKSLYDRIRTLAKQAPTPAPVASLGEKAKAHLAAFDDYLSQDLNTPRALAELWGLLRDTDVPADQALSAAFNMDEVLGLDLEKCLVVAAQPEEDPVFAAEINQLIEQRAAAKKARDFAKADQIRDAIKAKGVALEDSASGTTWRRL